MKNGKLLILIAAALLAGCLAGGPPAQRAVQEPAPPGSTRTIADLPWRELWYAVTVNGQAAGYVHAQLEPVGDGLFLYRSEQVLRVGGAKEMSVRMTETVGPDFSLRQLDQEEEIDGSIVRTSGRVRDDVLEVEVNQAGRIRRQAFPLGGQKLYSASGNELFAWLRGLGVGGEHALLVYEATEHRPVELRQQVAALERDEDLFEGEAARLETDYAGVEITSWVSPEGVPLAAQAMGAFLARLADEASARAALAAAREGKRDPLDEWALVRTGPIPCPVIARLEVEIEGFPAEYSPISDSRQVAEAHLGADGRRLVVFTIDAFAPLVAVPGDMSPYLAASSYVESDDEEIIRTAGQIVGRASGLEAVERVVRWVNATLRPSVKDRVSALDALHSGEGDCQAHAYLCAALLRAAGIPCRIVSGLSFAPEEGGFLYHDWCEAYCGGWLAVDAMAGGVADAGSIKLVEGEDLESWAPLAQMVGRIRGRVLEWRCAGEGGP